jgi:hypothetical protein
MLPYCSIHEVRRNRVALEIGAGSVGQWYSGTAVHWHSVTIAHWYSGTVAHWCIGTVAHWYSGTVAQASEVHCATCYRRAHLTTLLQ